MILLIYICCTANGGYKKPEVWPLQTVRSRAELQMMRKHSVKWEFCRSWGVCVCVCVRNRMVWKAAPHLIAEELLEQITPPFHFCHYSMHMYTQTLTHPALTIRADSLPYVIAEITNPKSTLRLVWHERWFPFTVFPFLLVWVLGRQNITHLNDLHWDGFQIVLLQNILYVWCLQLIKFLTCTCPIFVFSDCVLSRVFSLTFICWNGRCLHIFLKQRYVFFLP